MGKKKKTRRDEMVGDREPIQAFSHAGAGEEGEGEEESGGEPVAVA